MLKITITPPEEIYDEAHSKFIKVGLKPCTLQLEHSLVSISKWEAKWCKPFLSKEEKTLEQTIDYVKCMTITQNVDPRIYRFLSEENVKSINDYIEAPMTATTFWEPNGSGSAPNRETITSELIYYWMIALNIPMECQKWHLNRLLTLIRVCSVKNQPQKKMSKGEIMRRNSALNDSRRRKMHTKG